MVDEHPFRAKGFVASVTLIALTAIAMFIAFDIIDDTSPEQSYPLPQG